MPRGLSATHHTSQQSGNCGNNICYLYYVLIAIVTWTASKGEWRPEIIFVSHSLFSHYQTDFINYICMILSVISSYYNSHDIARKKLFFTSQPHISYHIFIGSSSKMSTLRHKAWLVKVFFIVTLFSLDIASHLRNVCFGCRIVNVHY